MNTNNIINAQAADDAAIMPDMTNKKIMMGFWHNWAAGASDGYQQGQFANMNLTDIPAEYNVVAVAFMKGDGIPTFKPYNLSDTEFRRQVGVLNSQGRAVLISLGGADAHIELKTGDEDKLANEIIRLVETYGFDGLDIDLEQAAIGAANNKTVLPAALKKVKAHYAAEGKNFIVSMAPEFPYLRTNGTYLDYITALEGYYDFIAPQYYNQGGDGIWVDEANGGKGAWITQNNDAMKEDFLYYLTESLVTGTRGYTKIPSAKFVIGLPTNNDAAATGYVVDKMAVYNAFARLDAKGLSIKGLMTWSVNWDNGKSKAGVAYNWEFKTHYAALIQGGVTPLPGKPDAPTALNATAIASTSLTLNWAAASSVNPVSQYTVYRNGSAIGQTGSLSLQDSGLTPATQYSYFVTATDNQGNTSLPSSALAVKTADGGTPPDPSPSEWQNSHSYKAGDVVTYKGKKYTCLQAHTSNVGWMPDAAFTLWQLTA
ncbi:Chitinase D precursor [Serratia proteamaculans]|uniref:chitinase n=1 Tax=Serratia proteamaculans TaxID=28151 RepID=A0ABS0TP30_SERPR|nr:glycosyl hydrolase family 18 protein [Serratia proteamaculans]KAB1496823.1 chitinase [Serratia proteamaculans]MBI6179111.1 chitinase [Serratia proteamaculans]RYM51809.1 chitinase [Serratia proteamaculans]RYM54354.1 chitinase [Serratia proteamaculans]CAI0754414.1 Chitinase D precursor [Serratia proteamaculans]